MAAEVTDQIFRGKNVEAAIAAGLAALGLRRDQVEVEIIHPGSRGILGIGAEDARVRLIPIRSEPVPPSPPASTEAALETRLPAPEPELVSTEAMLTPEASAEEKQILAEARELLQGLLDRMGFRACVQSYWAKRPTEEGGPALVLNIEGDDLGILIGRRGETLAALQFLIRLMMNHRRRRWMNIEVDVEEYKERRARQLRQLALRMAERVVQTGKPVVLEAMPARERRIIHMALRDHPRVTTQSVGEGERRKVTIRMRQEGN
ncbi:MAG: RNA-binding cell elongation regulator Jag/EloR [Anaerolineae bacterium]|nr:Jag N-terminal domain-containing protein [Anaerolineae bacterium]MDW8098997.1 RNA-binding cell elongation regulator Jag/EloR [Anaerolineae bacterium]